MEFTHAIVVDHENEEVTYGPINLTTPFYDPMRKMDLYKWYSAHSMREFLNRELAQEKEGEYTKIPVGLTYERDRPFLSIYVEGGLVDTVQFHESLLEAQHELARQAWYRRFDGENDDARVMQRVPDSNVLREVWSYRVNEVVPTRYPFHLMKPQDFYKAAVEKCGFGTLTSQEFRPLYEFLVLGVELEDLDPEERTTVETGTKRLYEACVTMHPELQQHPLRFSFTASPDLNQQEATV